MDWLRLITAVLAGGFLGQLLSVFWGHRNQRIRDHENWKRQRFYDASVELLNSISAAASRTEFYDWPDEIRVASQKLQLLFKNGSAPAGLQTSIQAAFGLALDRKLEKVSDLRKWRSQMRDLAHDIRKELSEHIRRPN